MDLLQGRNQGFGGADTVNNPNPYPCDDCDNVENCKVKRLCADYQIWRWYDVTDPIDDDRENGK